MNPVDPSCQLSLIIHKLHKEAHGPASIALRQGMMPDTPTTQALVNQLVAMYNAKPSKGYGKFEADEERFPLPKWLREHVNAKTLDFAGLTHAMKPKVRLHKIQYTRHETNSSFPSVMPRQT